MTYVTSTSAALRSRLADARVYLCTDARRETDDLARFADAALSGGVDIIQLRDKDSEGERQFGRIEPREELAALAVLRTVCDRHGALLAVNDRADIALAAQSDILHLGQNDLPVAVARRIVGDGMLIGRSTHSRAQAGLAAIEPGVDYFACGPVYRTPTKPKRQPAGLETIREVAAADPKLPWFAIGGIEDNTLDAVLDAGARRVVVVRAITRADDPRRAAAALARRVRERD